MRSSARRQVLILLGVAALIAGGLALFNFVIDPYNRYGNNRLGVYISAEREAKSTWVRSYPHTALIVGNSRMGVIPPGELEGFRFFNGAFAGANAEEVYWFIDHFARTQRVVVIGIDLGMQDPPAPKGDLFGPPTFGEIAHNLLNFQTVEYSIRTITEHLAGEPSNLGRDGLADMRGWKEMVDREDPAHRDWLLEDMKKVWGRFQMSGEGRFYYYRKIAELLRQRGIAAVVVVPPMHQTLARYLDTPELRAAFAEWLRQLQTIFPHVIDLSFSAYGAPGNYYRADPAHFKPEVGVQFINREVIPVARLAVARH